MTAHSNDPVANAHDQMIFLGGLVTRFACVSRAPRMPDGTRESDLEHSYHLALSATELAATYFPELDVGLVARYSLVHDLPELYAGDVWTFGITPEDRDKKEADEAAATERLLKELPPHTAQLLKRYESQSDQEALFVRFVDKMLPAVINYWAKDASTFKVDYNAHDREELHRRTQLWIHELKTRFPEYPFLHHLLERLDETSEDAVYSEG